ncbi:MAG: hypothetical protein U0640_15490 [Phycisphaerales bacterium]
MHTAKAKSCASDLPLWAQVLVAARAVRRAVLVSDTAPKERRLAACEAIERCVAQGHATSHEREALRRARDWQPTVHQHMLSLAVRQTIASADAAEASYDIAGAELQCERAAANVINAQCEDISLESQVVRACVNTDIQALTLACQQSKFSRYDAIPQNVLEALPRIDTHSPKEFTACCKEQSP